jgi:hypothetical protein
VIDKLKAPPAGYADTVLDQIGATPREALSGPMPPGFGVMACIAAPMLGDNRAWPVIAGAMAESGHGEQGWRQAILAALGGDE